jgi:hypothetical protein
MACALVSVQLLADLLLNVYDALIKAAVKRPVATI